jgi:hypothetical protein
MTTLVKEGFKCKNTNDWGGDTTDVELGAAKMMHNLTTNCPDGTKHFYHSAKDKKAGCCKEAQPLDAANITANADYNIYRAGGKNPAGWSATCYVKKTAARDSGVTYIKFKTDKGTTVGCGKDSYEFYGTTRTFKEFKAPAGQHIKALKQSNDPRSFNILDSVDAANV